VSNPVRVRSDMKATLRVTKALADLQRVRILMMLRLGELCVCQIMEVLALAPSTVSKHLSILSAAGLVDSRKEGRWMYYRRPERAAGAFVRPALKWLDDTLKNDETIKQDMKKLRTVVVYDPGSLCRRQRERDE
jgi:ArsR family transcriptional regulator, arsenate/arsenite/antimonite-responsive transcriptional repressor